MWSEAPLSSLPLGDSQEAQATMKECSGQKKCASSCGLTLILMLNLGTLNSQHLTSHDHAYLLQLCLCRSGLALPVFCHLCFSCVSRCLCALWPLFPVPLLSLPVCHCPQPQHSQASLCTRSLRQWRRTGQLDLNATLKGCQHPSLLGRRTS